METYQKIFEFAARYPSADNNQPFEINLISSGRFQIEHLPQRALHSLNIESYVSDIVLGCLKSYLEASAFRYGQRAHFAHFYPCSNNKVVSEFSLSSGMDMERGLSELISGLEQRYTERRPFQLKRTPPIGFEDRMKLETSLFEGNLTWKFRAEGFSTLLPSLEAAERAFWSSDNLFYELLHWIRASDREAQATQDGLPISTIGIPVHSQVFLKILKRAPKIYSMIKSLGLIAEQVRALKSAITSASMLGVAYVPPTVPFESRMAVGESFTRIWLWLSAQGWSLQPISFATQVPTLSKICDLPSDLRRFQSILNRAIADFDALFDPPKGWLPLWAFRAGPIDDLRPLPRTPRRPLLKTAG